MVTPFDAEGRVDYGAAGELAEWLIGQGSDGLVVTGSTGEAATLSDEEKIGLWQEVVRAVGGRAKVVAGTGTYDTAHSVHLTKKAQEAGVDGVLVVTPYYNRPPQSGLLAHFKAVAAATSLPVVLYDIPLRSGRKIDHSTILTLADVPNIVAIKDACGDAQGAARLAGEAPEGFDLYAGNDGDALPWLAVGAVGLVSTASHLVGPQMAEMIKLFHQGDAASARKIHLSLMPVFDVMNVTTNPIPLKAALGMIGHDVGAPRLPLPAATDEEMGRIRAVLAGAGVI